MSMRFLLALIAVLVPAFASAQSLEIFALTGVVQVWDDESNIGTGVPIGGGIGFRSPHGFGLEFLAEHQKATRDFASGVSFDSTVTAGRARLLKYFGSGGTQPFAGAGLGVARIESSRTEPPSIGGAVFRRTSTAGTLSGFAGVRISAGDHLFVRPEFELSKSGEHLRIGGMVAVGGAW